MKNLTEKEELKPNRFVFVYTTWLTQNKRYFALFDKLEKEYQDIFFYAIDAEFYIEFTDSHKIEYVPYFIFYRDNKEVERLTGLILSTPIKNKFLDIFKKNPNGEDNGKKTRRKRSEADNG